MPQIGWFEILIIVVLSIIIIGPKDFPVVLRKIGNWISHIKKYFHNIQREVTDLESDFEKGIFDEEENSKKIGKDNQDE